jgi:hypothetical protein
MEVPAKPANAQHLSASDIIFEATDVDLHKLADLQPQAAQPPAALPLIEISSEMHHLDSTLESVAMRSTRAQEHAIGPHHRYLQE